ncbi:entericidin A/B family lipoprotein [Aquabacterium sp. A08]|nr:entericidin A/B family lipoprotein [Aquabacterium sp. A08]NIC40664.1 entericidin A/B family lipoprotein [Aquabacterium sp. A08]
MKKTYALMISVLALVALTGCNTVAGIGKDVQKGGQVLQDAAK